MIRFDPLVHAALNAGADGAVIVPGESIVTNREFYAICEGNACGNYGRCWVCPPDAGDADALIQRVRSYPYGLLYQSIHPLEDSFDIEGMTAAAMAHAQLSRRVHERAVPMLLGESFHLGCGGCNLCVRCAKRDNLPCRFPDQALTPMEAAGVDVYNTTRDTPLKYINGMNTVTYFGLLLFREMNHA